MISTVLILSAIALSVGFLYWRRSRRELYEMAAKIPGPPHFEMIKDILSIKSHNDFFEVLYYKWSFDKKYKDVGKVWFGPWLFTILLNPKDIELVLGSSVHLSKSFEYKFFAPWFGNGLLISSGDKWKAHRKMIAPTFHLNVLRRFMYEFNVRAKSVCNNMRQEKEEFDCHEYMSACTVETLIETVMGVKGVIPGKTCHDYAMDVMDICSLISQRQISPWLGPKAIFNLTKMGSDHDRLLTQIMAMTEKVFKKKKESFTLGLKNDNKETKKEKDIIPDKEEIGNAIIDENFSFGASSQIKDDIDEDIGEKKRLAFLESLFDRSKQADGMTDQEIKDQVNTIMFEGHDTTAAGSSFFLAIMAARPDIQDKCVEELNHIFGDSDRDVTFQDTIEMKYLERCIMETLRLFPPVPVIARKLEYNQKLASSDIIIPAGCTVVIGTFKLHRRDDIYQNPDEFDPDNFLPDKAASRHYYSFIPFSAGPRSCVGRKYAMLKLKVILSTVLRQFRVTGGQPIDQWKLQADIILKRSDGFNIKLEPRKSVKIFE